MVAVNPTENTIPRICEILAASPFAVQPLQLRGDFVRLAEGLLLGRRTVFFEDRLLKDPIFSDPKRSAYVIESTPSVMPPMRHMFFDCRGDAIDGDKLSKVSIGISVDYHELLDQRDDVANENRQSIVDDYGIDPRGFMQIQVFVQDCAGGGGVSCPGSLILPITHEFKCPSPFSDDGTSRFRFCNHATGQMPDNHAARVCLKAAAVAVRAIGMANASNVRCVEGGRTNDHLSENTRAHRRLPWIKYHVLKLVVGTKLIDLPAYPDHPTGERDLPLHLVRGHFRDCSEHGLFGKYRGQKYAHIWVPAHLRGTGDGGVIVKDYEQDPGPPESSDADAEGGAA